MRMTTILLALAASLAVTPVAADPWKDKGGKGWKSEGRGNGRAKHRKVRIPPGHLPPPGYCRDWYDDLPPGHQPPPFRC